MRLAGPVAIVMLAAIPPTAAEPEPQSAGNWRVSWENVVTTTDGCFFFSGPNGRDDKLVGLASIVRDGDLVSIHIAKTVFRGNVSNEGFAVTRQSTHDFNGPWDVTETITGKSLESPIRARYRYTECEVGGRCPGECTINATIVFKR